MTSETALQESPCGCDCVAMKRAIQSRIYEETKHMTWDEEREHIRKGSEEFRAKIKRLRAEMAKESAT